MFESLSRSIKAFVLQKDGGMMTVVALMLPMMFGIGGIAVDMGYWYFDHRHEQTASDAAAIATALALVDGESSTDAILAGKAMAAVNGYSEANGSTVSISIDARTGQATASITRAADLFLLRIFGNLEGMDISTTATAGMQNSEAVCLLALQGHSEGITVNGGSGFKDIYATNCSVQANSSDSIAITTNGDNAWVEGQSVCANYSEQPVGSAVPHADPPAYSCPPILDPFPDQLAPEWDGTRGDCPSEMGAVTANGNGNAGVTSTIGSGCYINSDIVLTTTYIEFEFDGVFYFNNTHLVMEGAADEITGEDITIFLYGTSTINLAGASFTDLSAKSETDRNYPNILIAADASNSADLRDGIADTTLAGNVTTNITGIVHLPYQDLLITGSADLIANDSIIVANTITRSGNGQLIITAPGSGSTNRTTVMLLN